MGASFFDTLVYIICALMVFMIYPSAINQLIRLYIVFERFDEGCSRVREFRGHLDSRGLMKGVRVFIPPEGR